MATTAKHRGMTQQAPISTPPANTNSTTDSNATKLAIPKMESEKEQHQQHLESALKTFGKILRIQTKATHHLTNQHAHSQFTKTQLVRSLNIMNSSLLKGGKVVVCGVGKSHKIGSKMVATLNSLGVQSALLHPSEALHGDLGILRKENHDCLVMISSSGKSPELLQLLPHLALETPIVLLTNKKQSTLSVHPQVKSLLYAELPADLSEANIYGLNAPTISTTLCLTLADAASIALAELFVSDIEERRRIFGERHPGGAIGEAYRSMTGISSYLNTPNYSSTSMTSLTGLSPVSSYLGMIEPEPERPLSKVVFDMGYDDCIDEELGAKIASSSVKVLYLETLGNEIELLQCAVLYDYIVIQERFALSGEKLREVIRSVYEQGHGDKERYTEVIWRAKQGFVRVK